MNEDNETGSSGSSYISHGSCQYIIDIPGPPTIFIEWSADIPQPGISKIVLFHLSAIIWIPIVLLILYNKKICWTQLPNQLVHYKRWNNPEKQLLLPGGVFQNQGFFYAMHLHHPKAYRVDTPPDYGYVSHGCFFHCNQLIIQALRYHPENIWIDKHSQLYLEAIKRNRAHGYICDDVYGPKGSHQYQPGYNCKTILPFKKRSSIVNHCVGDIRFGDITYIESSYEDLGKPKENSPCIYYESESSLCFLHTISSSYRT
jgi:hypothetical protein